MMGALPNWHPALVHFPIALFVVAVLADVALLVRFRTVAFDRAVVALYAAASAGAGAAAISGKLALDALGPELAEAARLLGEEHGDWAFFTVVLFFGTLGLRLEARFRDKGYSAPRWGRSRGLALLLALSALGVLVGTAAKGGELVYRYGVGVARTPMEGEE